MTDTAKPVRVRYAPSPTGLQHVGGLRTALYNYLLAEKTGGQFLLRIEDTDQKRFVAGAVENIMGFLKDFGLRYHEGPIALADKSDHEAGALSTRYPGVYEKGEHGPYIQSERLAHYEAAVKQLVDGGHAYYCFCTEERLAELRARQEQTKQPPRYDGLCRALTREAAAEERRSGKPCVVRFRVPEDRGEIVCRDALRGELRYQAQTLEDFVLLKTDGYPTYHLANVVDDRAMEITHVFRSEEWLPSFPKHVLIYEALGYEQPIFAHLSVILGADGKKKLSKRDGDVSVDAFVQAGYLHEALINFVALLGWNPGKGSTQEIFSLPELVEHFSMEHLNAAPAMFDRKKLDWMNHEYIAKLSVEELLARVRALGVIEQSDWYRKAPAEFQTDSYLLRVLAVEQERLKTLVEAGANDPYFFTEILDYPAERLAWKGSEREATRAELVRAQELLASLSESEWTRETLGTKLLQAAGDKKGDFLWPLRVALTGAERSPSPMDAAWVLGKTVSLTRLERAIAKLAA